MRRQYAIASAGRTASTTLFDTVVRTLQVRNSVCPIWDFSPADKLADAYAGDQYDYIVVKGETWHFIDQLRHRDATTLILLTRRDHLRQIVSHLVSLRAGRFHAGESAPPAAPFRVGRHEFLSLAHMILAMEEHFRTADLSGFGAVERWEFETLTADLPSHMGLLGIQAPRITERRGVPHDEGRVLNMDEVRCWASALAAEGLRVGPA